MESPDTKTLATLSIPMPDELPSLSADALVKIVDGLSSPLTATESDYTGVSELLLDVKSRAGKLDAKRREMLAPVNETRDKINALFKAPLDALVRAEATVKHWMVDWKNERERERQEQQRKLDDAARQERERLARQAAKAEADGRGARADELRQRSEAVVAPIVHRDPPKVAGVQNREAWKYQITDESKLPREFLMPDEPKLGQYARAMKSSAKVEGVRFWNEGTIAAGRK